MHVSSWLQAAVIPDRWRVAGVHCFALSVWHHFVLEELGNAYSWELPEADIDAAAELLIFCSRGYAEGKLLFVQDARRARVQRDMYCTLRDIDPDLVNAQVLDYFKTCTRTPGHKGAPVKIEDGKRVPAKDERKFIVAPQEWVMVEFFSRGDPARIAAAWDMPFATARCLFDAHRNAAGDDLSLESRSDEARIDAYNARELAAKERAS